MKGKQKSGLYRERGFTLIEIALVATMVGIMAIVAIPKIVSTDKHAVYMVARQITADMRYAQKLAISNADDYTVTFHRDSTDPGTPYTSYDISDSGGTSVKFMEISEQVDCTIPDSIALDWEISFTRLGSAEVDGASIDGVIISLDADGSYAQDINVISATGRVYQVEGGG